MYHYQVQLYVYQYSCSRKPRRGGSSDPAAAAAAILDLVSRLDEKASMRITHLSLSSLPLPCCGTCTTIEFHAFAFFWSLRQHVAENKVPWRKRFMPEAPTAQRHHHP